MLIVVHLKEFDSCTITVVTNAVTHFKKAKMHKYV